MDPRFKILCLGVGRGHEARKEDLEGGGYGRVGNEQKGVRVGQREGSGGKGSIKKKCVRKLDN